MGKGEREEIKGKGSEVGELLVYLCIRKSC